MKLRAEETSDHAAVEALHRRAFADDGPKGAALLQDLRPSSTLSLVAEVDDSLVGHVLFSPAWLDTPQELLVVPLLSPVGVLPEHQGAGVGSALIRHGIEYLTHHQIPMVFLEGDPRYYSRLGFRAAGDLGFRKPSLRIPDAAFQVVLLPAFEEWMSGTLVYPSTFWEHDAVGLR